MPRLGGHRTVERLAVGLVALVTLMFAVIGVIYSLHGAPAEHVVAPGSRGGLPSVDDTLFPRTIALLTDTPLSTGNAVELMTDGDETYPRLWADLRGARRSVTIQMYYVNAGAMATRMKDILIERARAGVRVLFLYDAFGGEGLPQNYLDSLSAAHITVASFRPVRWYSIDKAQTRSHVRAVVVDGRIGYTGGFGLDDKWYGDGRHANQWRDSNVRFTGPAVLQLQAAFAAGWAEATGELLTGDLFFPASRAPAAPPGAPVAGLLYATPTMGSTAAQRFLALSIAGARHRLYITNSYFVPDDGFRDLLKRAAALGVDVRVLTAGPGTDVKTTRYAGRHRYEELLRAGVKIYEYQPGMMHAKSFVVDGLWSSVGSMNFDNRSITFNDESNLVALDPALGATLDSVFVGDLRYATPITLDAFLRRPAIDHVLEAGANMLSRLL